MADELIDPESENVVDDADPFEYLLDTVEEDDEYGDIVTDYRDLTKYGIDYGLLDEIRQRSEVSELISNVDLRRLQRQLTIIRAQARAEYKNRPEPYEFRFFPVAGNNSAGLPRSGIVLPLPPEKFDMSRGSEPRVFVSINQREYTLPGPKSLATVSLEGMFPFSDPTKWATAESVKPNYLPRYITSSTFKTPTELVKIFSKLMVNAQPVTLTVGAPAGSTTPIDKGGFSPLEKKQMDFTVIGFTWGEAFGHPGSYVFAMELRQWQPTYPQEPRSSNLSSTTTRPSTNRSNSRSRNVVNHGPTPKRNQRARPKPKVYTIRSGDTLWDISSRFLGDGKQWRRIYSLNKKVIDQACKRNGFSTYPAGWHLFAGTKIKIPERRRSDG